MTAATANLAGLTGGTVQTAGQRTAPSAAGPVTTVQWQTTAPGTPALVMQWQVGAAEAPAGNAQGQAGMGFGIAVKALDAAGGAQLGGLAAPWTVEGQTIVCTGDPVTPHEPGPPHKPSPVMAQGSAWFTINGVPVCREGHLASCNHATSGRSWWTLPE